MLLLTALKKAGRMSYASIILLLSYTDIRPESFWILWFFLVMDTITWVTKVIAIWWKPTNRRFILGVISKLLLLMVPLMLSLLAKVTVPDREIQKMLGMAMGLLCLAEFYSIIQNIVSIRLRKEVEEYDAITKVFVYILKYIRSILDKNLPKQ